MKTRRIGATAITLSMLVAACGDNTQQAPSQAPQTELASGVVARPAPAQRKAWFGDLHLHTGMSFDAASAQTNTTPEQAYRFAQGEPVEYFGRMVKRNTPLDFLAVTDHSEYLGVALQAADPAGAFANTEWPARLAKAKGNMNEFLRYFSPSGFRGGPAVPEFITPEIVRPNWQRQVSAAEQFNKPGQFTAFVAYEWSPMPGGAHMHRNVIFRGPRYPEIPFTSLDSQKPEDLWTYAEARKAEGIDVLLIPHNSNLSEGLMFAGKDSYGNPLSRAYAERRSALERLAEISQIKGTSETRPEFSPTDEFAAFEILDFGQNPDADLRGGYLRPALQRGLEIQQTTGANPFKLGFIGSSDFHSGLSSSEENNFPGGLGDGDEQSNPSRVLTEVNALMRAPITIMSASGLAGIWAEENTRESLFDAMQRREVFATSGNKIRVRLFAGWEYQNGFTHDADWVSSAYAKGVPMGSDLPAGDHKTAPRFALQAVKDPEAGNLDRIQVIKLWLDNGVAKEKVFEAVWAGDRQLNAEGKLPVIGSTVDAATASYTNTIGAVELLGEWQDPDFDPSQSALYYARVLEIPTPRWSTYLAVRNGLPLSTSAPVSLQERAWSSPVFYQP